MNLEPLLLEIRDRCLEATGQEPREVLANRGFKMDLLSTVLLNWDDVTNLDPWYMEWNGIPVRCILPTDATTLIVRT